MHAGEPSLYSRSSKTPTTACTLALVPLTSILSQPTPAVKEIRVPYETYVQIEEKRGGVEVDLLVGVGCSKRGPSKQRTGTLELRARSESFLLLSHSLQLPTQVRKVHFSRHAQLSLTSSSPSSLALSSPQFLPGFSSLRYSVRAHVPTRLACHLELSPSPPSPWELPPSRPQRIPSLRSILARPSSSALALLS